LLTCVYEEGKKYGFVLRHTYTFRDNVEAKMKPLQILKGSDAILFYIAQQLGFEVLLMGTVRSPFGINF
jgi:hypothetical protein